MVCNGKDGEDPSIWLLDSGTLSYMTGRRDLFYQLDENIKNKVSLCYDKEVDVLGKGSMAIQVNGRPKLIHGVKFVPSLTHNLLKVGQLIENGYNVNFSRFGCKIENAEIGVVLMTI